MNAIQLATQNNALAFNDEQMKLLKTTIAKDATDSELALFINQCKRTGLDPFTKQIYFIKDKNGKVTICTSIDGLRLIAERSGKYQGQTEPQWCGEDGVWRDVWLSKEPPAAARIGVYKEGFKAPVYGVALFTEYAGYYSYDDKFGKYKKGDLTHMWDKMRAHMISKIAEAIAFRKAFPNDLSGLYATEEVSQQVESFEAREANTTPPAATQLSNALDPYIFSGGKFQGKHFNDVNPSDFISELSKYEAVEKKTPNLLKLIETMNQYLTERNMAELDAKLGINQK
jgi:phage recombination protein Bet